MMSKMVGCALAVQVVLAICVCPARAAEDNWGWALAAGSGSQTSGSYGGVGVYPDSIDGSDANDYLAGSGAKVFCGTYHAHDPDSWSGPTGMYAYDRRAPVPHTIEAHRTWTVYCWADPSLPSDLTYISFTWLCARTAPAWLSVTLRLAAKPAGVTGGPAVGTMWNLSAQSDAGVQLPVFRTSDGREGYVFDFTATVIPEPSSLLAILASLGGFGMLLRRRIR
jgi:hypothetical protein